LWAQNTLGRSNWEDWEGRWYASFDAEAWDRQFEADVKAGKLDALADKALRAHTSGQSKPL